MSRERECNQIQACSKYALISGLGAQSDFSGRLYWVSSQPPEIRISRLTEPPVMSPAVWSEPVQALPSGWA